MRENSFKKLTSGVNHYNDKSQKNTSGANRAASEFTTTCNASIVVG
jgi:hypothetical protein